MISGTADNNKACMDPASWQQLQAKAKDTGTYLPVGSSAGPMSTSGYIAPVHPRPCSTCGTCPTCGSHRDQNHWTMYR